MTSDQSYLVYLAKSPWIFLVASRPLFSYGAGFTSPNSVQRYLVFVILSLYVWITLANFTTYIQSTGYWVSIIAGSIFALPLVYFDRLILRKWTFEDRQAIFGTTFDQDAKKDAKPPAKIAATANTEDTVGSRFAFGNEVSGTLRGPGTSWEVKGLPHFSSSDPQWVPSLLLFITWRLAALMGCFFLNDYIVEARVTLDKKLLQPSLVPFFTRIGEVTQGEVWTRLSVGVTTWAGAYCLLQVFFGIPALVCVCLKPNSIQEWRPFFGPFSEVYTVRGFWGRFWHQNLQLNLHGPARFITHDVLRLPRTGLMQRYTFIFFVFFVSGSLHAITDMAASIPISDSGALRFFCTQALGIMLEDGAQEIYRRLGGKPRLLTRIVGYIWVLAFLSWSTAVWQYPAILVTKKEDVVFRPIAFRSLGPPRKL